MRCDVLVAGGGSAGIAAAVAAARSGARTLLVERSGALGGMATAALVHSICGLFLIREEKGVRLANRGFPAEFAGRLLQSGGATAPVRLGKLDVLFHRPAVFAHVADLAVSEEKNLEVRLHTEIIGAETNSPNGKSNAIASVEICCREKREIIEPKAVVDASGDGAIAQLSGAAFEKEPTEKLQRPAFVFSLQGVKMEALTDSRRFKIAHRIASAVHDGILPRGALGAGLRHGISRREVFVTIDLDAPDGMEFDPLKPECLTALEMQGRSLAMAVSEFLRRGIDGFANSELAAFPSRIGVRESRRIKGEYAIQESDILRGAEFPDAVALSAWPMELREQATGPRFRFAEKNRACEIPLRALRADSMENFFVAGRCISSSHMAQASLRVIGACFATGEAAGLAASLMANSGKQEDARDAAAKVVALKERLMIPRGECFAF